ncbi:alpha-E domain-containing protein [Pseudalkalibacillus salsuginis]|uniref:alpha-E domain-containing protein n=1 Tax=Pseudalkalibacillus salsuginis TaxID=2910972 RepID=UPI001F1EBDAC|nr:alpha-E domain-containing protein [Pseudalkalibacillus salsuginis]MCF6410958.1 alpha-E domain-containing protein [Pseudalkalibacillus salsuginis]
MLSRVSNSLYWMSRNIERAENTARLISVRLIGSIEHKENHWDELISISGANEDFEKRYDKYDARSVMDFMSFSSDNPNSILNCVKLAREDARAIREIIPQELWEMMNSFYWEVKQYKYENWTVDSIDDFYQMIIRQSALFQGMVEATLSFDEAYLFIKMAKFIERAEKTSRILNIYYYRSEDPEHNDPSLYRHWFAVLQSVSGHEAYLKKHHPFITGERVIEFLLFDEAFPRSINYCLEQVYNVFQELENGKIEHYSEDLHQLIGEMRLDFKTMSVIDVITEDIHQFLQRFQSNCSQLGRLINKTYYLGEVGV